MPAARDICTRVEAVEVVLGGGDEPRPGVGNFLLSMPSTPRNQPLRALRPSAQGGIAGSQILRSLQSARSRVGAALALADLVRATEGDGRLRPARGSIRQPVRRDRTVDGAVQLSPQVVQDGAWRAEKATRLFGLMCQETDQDIQHIRRAYSGDVFHHVTERFYFFALI
jgi:hypothetical protein